MTPDDLTYPETLHGATARLDDVRELLADGGFHIDEVTEVIGTGRHVFEEAVARLLSGVAHAQAGAPLRRRRDMRNSDLRAGERVDVRPLGIGLALVRSPCLVLTAQYSPRAAELVYGTLPGHLECGEERFRVTIDDDEMVTVSITAFSRPGKALTRIAGPVGRSAQQWMARRYLAAIADRS